MQPSTIMTIGPAEATRLLENNKDNRSISDKVVQQYAREMAAGNWRETGNPINIGVSGNLLNGQHRLWAIIESGVTLRFHVIYETDEEAFATFDTGRTRDLTALIGMRHAEHPDKACVGGAARLVRMWEETPRDRNFNPNTLPTRQSMVEYASEMLEDPDFDWATRVAGQNVPLRVGRTWYAAALYVIASSQNKSEEAEDMVVGFHNGVAKGIGLEEGDPRLALRTYVTKRGAPRGISEQRIYMALTVRAWNAFVKGRRLANVTWRGDSVFPEVVSA